MCVCVCVVKSTRVCVCVCVCVCACMCWPRVWGLRFKDLPRYFYRLGVYLGVDLTRSCCMHGCTRTTGSRLWRLCRPAWWAAVAPRQARLPPAPPAAALLPPLRPPPPPAAVAAVAAARARARARWPTCLRRWPRCRGWTARRCCRCGAFGPLKRPSGLGPRMWVGRWVQSGVKPIRALGLGPIGLGNLGMDVCHSFS